MTDERFEYLTDRIRHVYTLNANWQSVTTSKNADCFDEWLAAVEERAAERARPKTVEDTIHNARKTLGNAVKLLDAIDAYLGEQNEN